MFSWFFWGYFLGVGGLLGFFVFWCCYGFSWGFFRVFEFLGFKGFRRFRVGLGADIHLDEFRDHCHQQLVFQRPPRWTAGESQYAGQVEALELNPTKP